MGSPGELLSNFHIERKGIISQPGNRKQADHDRCRALKLLKMKDLYGKTLTSQEDTMRTIQIGDKVSAPGLFGGTLTGIVVRIIMTKEKTGNERPTHVVVLNKYGFHPSYKIGDVKKIA
jgi:hypothetical protein